MLALINIYMCVCVWRNFNLIYTINAGMEGKYGLTLTINAGREGNTDSLILIYTNNAGKEGKYGLTHTNLHY